MDVTSRYSAAYVPAVAEGWVLDRVTPPTRLHGANGMRAGPDGRLYIAQCIGSQIAALDPDSGAMETICRMGGDIVGPDDLAFDRAGNLFVTECMNARVSVVEPTGRVRVLRDDVPGANGITFFQDRLFVDECRLGGRLLELDLAGGPPRVLLEDLELPNALEAGPDGLLYFPLVGANEIWRVHPDGGPAECVAAGLANPVAVKFDSQGRMVSPQSHTGEVLRIDPANGRREVLARLAPGVDNLAFLGDRLFVSHHTTGQISEICAEGAVREILSAGFLFPLGVASDAEGDILLSDNSTIYRLASGNDPLVVGRVFEPGFPGSCRGLAVGRDGILVSTTDGRIVAWHPGEKRSETLASGLDQPVGVVVGERGEIWVAEKGGGRVLCLAADGEGASIDGLRAPMGVAANPGGGCFVAESGGGRIVRVDRSGAAVVIAEGLGEPQGIAVAGDTLAVVDAAARAVLAIDLPSGAVRSLASDLPIGPPPGVSAKPLLGMPPLSGPFGPFAGIAAGREGSLYFAADGEGCLIRLRPHG